MTFLQDYIHNEEFNPDIIGKKSFAAAGLCSWAINIVKYYEVFCDVLPKRLALEDANKELNAAKEKLSGIQAKIAVGASDLVSIELVSANSS